MDISKRDVCRLCMGVKPSLHIFTDELTFISKIQSCCSLQVYKNDGLPHRICTACADILEIIVNFRNKCKESDRILRQTLNITDCLLNEADIKSEDSITDYEYPEVKLEVEDQTSLFQNIDKTENNNIALINLNTLENKILKENNPKFKKNTNKKNAVKNSLVKSNLKLKIGKKNKFVNTDCKSGSIKNNVDKSKRKPKPKKTKQKGYFSNLCPFCGMIFSKSSSYHKHLKTHTDQSYICAICSKIFYERGKLLAHIKTHGEKEFPCEICGKLFKTSYDSHRHVEIVHKRSRSAECHMCGKRLATKFGLKMHIKTHTGEKEYECDICKQKFTFRYTLLLHMRTHTGEKPYTCKYCGASFSVHKTLKEHERLHTGETPYCCPVCTKGFSQLSNMKSHFRNNHKGVEFNYKHSRSKNNDSMSTIK